MNRPRTPLEKAIGLQPIDIILLVRLRRVMSYPLPPHEEYRPNKSGAERGKVKRVALAFIAGEYGLASVADVAAQNRISDQSLKNTVWRLRNGWKEPERKTHKETAA